jgi:hypothetical protein
LLASEALSIRAELLERGGGELLERFMAELRAEHLRGQNAGAVRAELRAAYEAKLAKIRKRARQPAAVESAARRQRRRSVVLRQVHLVYFTADVCSRRTELTFESISVRVPVSVQRGFRCNFGLRRLSSRCAR